MMTEKKVDPLEQPQIQQDWSPHRYRFTRKDSDLFWMLDTAHAPELFYPLEYDTIGPATSHGYNWANDFHCYPTSHGIETRYLNDRLYQHPLEISDPEEIQQRNSKFEKNMKRYWANWDKLWAKKERQVEKWLQWLENLNYEKDPDMNDVTQRLKLLTYLERIIEIIFRAWEIHFEFLIPSEAAVLMYRSICKEVVPGFSDEDIPKCLQGNGNKLMDTDAEFWKLAELALKQNIATVITDSSLEDVVPELEKGENGRIWVRELEKTVKHYGMRQTGGAKGICSISWLEDLTFPISFIKSFIVKIEKGEKRIEPERLQLEREQQKREFLEKINTEADKKRFLEALKIVQHVYSWIEDHNFIFEGRLNTLVHLKIMELGRRLANEGYLNEPMDISYLLTHELRAVLLDLLFKYTQHRSYNKTNFMDLIKQRQEARQRRSEWAPPIMLGLPPKEVPTDPSLVLIEGTTAENLPRYGAAAEESTALVEISGFPASPGVCEGIARVVLNSKNLKEIATDEVMICGETNPMWNPVFPKIKAVVTDAGGPLCHAGIIAREYGIPAVVGTGNATTSIKTGDKIKVDGEKGIVTKR